MAVAANPTPTSRLQLEKQTVDSNENAWGTRLNNSLDLVDLAFSVEEVTVSGPVTLTTTNYVDNQARAMCLILSGAGGDTVTTPAVDKPYFVINNCSAAVTMTPSGGTGVSVRAGFKGWFYTDAAGAVGYVADMTLDKIAAPTASVDLNSQKITSLADPTSAQDAATQAYVLARKVTDLTAPTSSFAMNSQKITGLADGVDANDAVNVSQTTGIVTAAQAAQTAAETAQTNAETAETNAETAQTAAEAAQSYAEEWAVKAEDSLVSVPAGGDGATDYSALHWAAKAAASAASIGTEFTDSTFRVQDNADATKEIAFEASGITTGTTRTLTVPDASGTIALISDVTAAASPYTVGTVVTLSNDATVDFTIDSAKEQTVFEFQDVIPATDAVGLLLLASTDSGSNYTVPITTINNAFVGGTVNNNNSTGVTTGALIAGAAANYYVGSSANEYGLTLTCKFSQLSGNYGRLTVYGAHYADLDGRAIFVLSHAFIKTTSTITNLRFQFQSGNLESGRIIPITLETT